MTGRRHNHYRWPRLTWGVVALGWYLGWVIPIGEARVFMRWGRADRQSLAAETTGWQPAQQGTVQIDGQTYELQVFGSRGSVQQTLARVERIYRERDAHVHIWPGRELGVGQAIWPDRETRVLVVAPPAWSQQLVFLVHGRTAPRDREGPATPILNLPVFPGARRGSHISRPDSGVHTAFWRTTATVRDVWAFYDQAMVAAGWTPYFTVERGRRAAAPLAVYTKGNQLCYVQVSPVNNRPGEQMITVLVKDS